MKIIDNKLYKDILNVLINDENIDYIKNGINKEINLTIEEYISEENSDFVKKVELPHWFYKNKINKIYYSDIIECIIYKEIINKIINTSNIVETQFVEEINTNNTTYLNHSNFLEQLHVNYNGKLNLQNFLQRNLYFLILDCNVINYIHQRNILP